MLQLSRICIRLSKQGYISENRMVLNLIKGKYIKILYSKFECLACVLKNLAVVCMVHSITSINWKLKLSESANDHNISRNTKHNTNNLRSWTFFTLCDQQHRSSQRQVNKQGLLTWSIYHKFITSHIKWWLDLPLQQRWKTE